jgi:hypothetical protein
MAGRLGAVTVNEHVITSIYMYHTSTVRLLNAFTRLLNVYSALPTKSK